MFHMNQNMKVVLVIAPIYLRKSFNELYVIASNERGEKPKYGALFVLQSVGLQGFDRCEETQLQGEPFPPYFDRKQTTSTFTEQNVKLLTGKNSRLKVTLHDLNLKLHRNIMDCATQ